MEKSDILEVLGFSIKHTFPLGILSGIAIFVTNHIVYNYSKIPNLNGKDLLFSFLVGASVYLITCFSFIEFYRKVKNIFYLIVPAICFIVGTMEASAYINSIIDYIK